MRQHFDDVRQYLKDDLRELLFVLPASLPAGGTVIRSMSWPAVSDFARWPTLPPRVAPYTRSGIAPYRRKRGRKPVKFEQVKEAMKRDIAEGRQTVSSLNAMLEKELEHIYGVSRDTVRRARNAVLSEYVENSNSDKSSTNDK
jgi:hypothetical protein